MYSPLTLKNSFVKFLISNIPAKFEAMLADNLAVVVVKLKGAAGLRQLAFKIVSKKTEGAIQGDVGYTLELRTEARVNSATKAWANRRIWLGRRTERSSGSVNERRVRASAKAKLSGNSAAARCRDGIGDGGRIKTAAGLHGNR